MVISTFSIYVTAQDNSQDNDVDKNSLDENSIDDIEEDDLEIDDENEVEEESESDLADEDLEEEFEENEEKGDDEEIGESDSEDEIIEELEGEFGDSVELEESAGTTPDSAFYGIDNFFDENFGDPERVREEKFAEIREMLKNGNEEDARKALEKYKKYADEFENDADPSKREKARRSAAAIRRIAKEEFKEEFSKDILEKERNLVTAVEIASRIKDLCTELAKLDPGQFHKTCKTENDSPRWQKDLFDDLTTEQKREVEKFIEVISNCFEDSTNCKCEESTNIQSFVEQCKIISEAEAKCRQGDDTACNIADETGEDIFDSLSSAPPFTRCLGTYRKKIQ